MIKIFALPSHQTKQRTSGVDFARVIQPMKALNGYKNNGVEFKVDLFDIHEVKPTDWLKVSQEYDIIFFNYINNPWAYAAMGAMARKNGVKLVLDLDDSLWNLKDDNSAYSVYKPGSEALRDFTSIVNDVDHVTTTNRYLKNVIAHNTLKTHDKMTAIDNFVDLENIYTYRAPFKDETQIKLLHFGSTTHFNDLMTEEFAKGVDQIFKEFPNVSIKFVGAFLPKYRMRWGSRFENAYGHEDIYTWAREKFPTFMDECDILVCPLTDDTYNRCKSGIKYLETSSTKKPGVYQDMEQYQKYIKNGVNGYLAKTQKQWYESIKELILNVEKRKQMGEEAFKTVQNETIQENVRLYAEMFKKIISS